MSTPLLAPWKIRAVFRRVRHIFNFDRNEHSERGHSVFACDALTRHLFAHMFQCCGMDRRSNTPAAGRNRSKLPNVVAPKIVFALVVTDLLSDYTAVVPT